MNLLFICTSNIKRSRTAEDLFSACPNINTRSAGTSAASTGNQVSQELIQWADKIFVMSEKEEGHLSYIKNNFKLRDTEIYDLGISDMYVYNAKELKILLIERISSHIDLHLCMENLLHSIRKSG